MKSKFSKIIDQIPPSGIREFFDLVAQSDDVISLGVGEPDFVTPWHIRAEAIYSLENGQTSYTSNKGLPECRQEIANYMDRRFGCCYDADEEIIVTVGVSEAIDIALRAILNPGDEVIVPEPTFVCYAPLVQLAGGTVRSLDTSKTDFIPDIKALEKAITKNTKAIILCSPNNPTGRVIPKKILQGIADLAEKHDFWVISDEVYAELTYDKSFVSFGALKKMKARTILLNGFSKAFAMTGWRLGFLCAPADLTSRALKIHQYAMMCASITAQYAAIDALKNGQSEVEDMRDSYLQRRNLCVHRFNEMGLDLVAPEGAFYCFPSIRKTGLSSKEFATKLLKSERVAVVPGSAFGLGGEGHIRCCYATNLKDLEIALQRVAHFTGSIRSA